jgi:ribosomal protein S18 acetylase RimI-like enzyme
MFVNNVKNVEFFYNEESHKHYKQIQDMLRESWSNYPHWDYVSEFKESIVEGVIKEGQVVACAVLEKSQQGDVQIKYLVVCNEHQGNGYGKLLMKSIVTRYVQNTVSIKVRINNVKAIYLYESHGFNIVEKDHEMFDDVEDGSREGFVMIKPAYCSM